MLDQLDANTESYSNLTAIKHQEIDLKNTFKAKGYLHYKSIEVDHFSKLLLAKEFKNLKKILLHLHILKGLEDTEMP